MPEHEATSVTVQLSPHVQWTQAKHGSFFVLKSDTFVGRSLVEYGEWTEGELDLILQVLRPGDHVLDIGANIGSHAVPMAKRVSPSGTVCCFEPQPLIFQLLATNIITNGLDNVRLFNAGVGDAPGTIPIPYIDYSRSGNYGAINLNQVADAVTRAKASPSSYRDVPIVRIDDVYRLPALRLIKIDVEGMEATVLKGAQATIQRFRPVLFVENEHQDKSSDLLESLFALGYDCYWHIAPCFRPKNFRNRTENIFGKISCVNVFCLPTEAAQKVQGMPKVTSVDGHPRKMQTARTVEQS